MANAGTMPFSNGTLKDSPTILIIEDEALLRAVLSAYLEECGYKVLRAKNADEAVLIIEKAGVAVDAPTRHFWSSPMIFAVSWCKLGPR
jgi:CheY-like chemotaxis protein